MVKAMKLQKMIQRRRINLFGKDKPYRKHHVGIPSTYPPPLAIRICGGAENGYKSKYAGFDPKHHGDSLATTVVKPDARKLQKKRSRTNLSLETKPYKRHHVGALTPVRETRKRKNEPGLYFYLMEHYKTK